MRLVHYCPKCGQTDKGFSQETLQAIDVDNDLKPIAGAMPELLPDATLFWCAADECGWADEQVPNKEVE